MAGGGPLAAVTVAVTRAAHQAPSLVEALQALGATVVAVPLIEVTPDDAGLTALRQCLIDPAHEPDVVIVTSPNGARCLAQAWPWQPADKPTGGPTVVVVGPGTADALRAAGGPAATAMAEEHVAEGVVRLLGRGTGRVVVAQGDLARPVVVEGLRAQGWDVTAVTVYRTVMRTLSAEQYQQVADADLVTLASGSAARSWSAALAGRVGPAVVVMGPATEQVARELHFDIAAVAHPHTLDGLVEATVRAAHVHRRGGTTPAS